MSSRYDDIMRIGEVAREAGVSTKAIRFYEETGVMPDPDRAENGYRVYGTESVGRLRFIKESQSAGLSLEEIATILELRDRGESTCHHTLALLKTHLADVERQIGELHRTQDRLARMIAKSESLDPAHCVDPNRCQTISAG